MDEGVSGLLESVMDKRTMVIRAVMVVIAVLGYGFWFEQWLVRGIAILQFSRPFVGFITQ